MNLNAGAASWTPSSSQPPRSSAPRGAQQIQAPPIPPPEAYGHLQDGYYPQGPGPQGYFFPPPYAAAPYLYEDSEITIQSPDGMVYEESYGEPMPDELSDGEEIDLVMSEIEAELELDLNRKAGTQQATTLPPFANEMWFPECRDCSCCSGFKHGCSCCSGAINTCIKPGCSAGGASAPASVTTPSAPRSPVRAPNNTSKEDWFPESRNCPCCNGFKYKCQCITSSQSFCNNPSCLSEVPGARADSDVVIVPPAQVPAQVAPVHRSRGGKKVCVYFQQGRCTYGDSCYFGHY
jgi:hypothetical protein